MTREEQHREDRDHGGRKRDAAAVVRTGCLHGYIWYQITCACGTTLAKDSLQCPTCGTEHDNPTRITI